jgi:hypothetical protein
MDEKGFLLSIISRMRRIVLLQSLKEGKIKGAIQDGSREFISLLAAISATSERMPPALIYRSDSGDMQDSWLEDFDTTSQNAFFGLSQTGWTSNDHGLSWLSRFHEHTQNGY